MRTRFATAIATLTGYGRAVGAATLLPVVPARHRRSRRQDWHTRAIWTTLRKIALLPPPTIQQSQELHDHDHRSFGCPPVSSWRLPSRWRTRPSSPLRTSRPGETTSELASRSTSKPSRDRSPWSTPASCSCPSTTGCPPRSRSIPTKATTVCSPPVPPAQGAAAGRRTSTRRHAASPCGPATYNSSGRRFPSTIRAPDPRHLRPSRIRQGKRSRRLRFQCVRF